MKTMQKFVGINNVKPAEELKDAELTQASNVDLDLEGIVLRRAGYVSASAAKHANAWQAAGFALATRGVAGDLVNVDDDIVLVAALGHSRVWYWNLPDGRTLYSNGTSQGIVTSASAVRWGVPAPAGIGVAADVAGQLHPGKYQWALTHQRLVDGIEGPPVYSNAGAIDLVLGGISLTALPVLAGHRTKVYLTSHYGGERFLAGTTAGAAFSFTGKNNELQRRCPTDLMQEPPVGKLVGFWRGRTLVAVGKALYASRPNGWQIFDRRRDFKPFSANITMVQPVSGGIWVGTEQELSFLAGDKWDSLVRMPKMLGAVTPGSGVQVPGEHITLGNGRGDGDCMICIASGWLVAGTSSGQVVPMTMDRYRTTAAEVASAFRVINGVPQYVAIEQ